MKRKATINSYGYMKALVKFYVNVHLHHYGMHRLEYQELSHATNQNFIAKKTETNKEK
jgi:hypothetical protein